MQSRGMHEVFSAVVEFCTGVGLLQRLDTLCGKERSVSIFWDLQILSHDSSCFLNINTNKALVAEAAYYPILLFIVSSIVDIFYDA